MKTVRSCADAKTITVLQQNPLFEGCPDLVNEIAGTCDTVSFSAGETVVSPSQSVTYLGIVLSGTLQVFADNTCEKKLLRMLDKGTLFGVVGLTDGQRYASLIIAKTDAVILCTPREKVLSMLKTNGRFMENYVSFLTGRIRFLNRKVEYLSQGSAASRLAAYLLSLVPRNREESGPVTVTPDYTAVELSELLNLGRASLYRAFDVLEQKGLVKKSGRLYIISSTEKLKSLLKAEEKL